MKFINWLWETTKNASMIFGILIILTIESYKNNMLTASDYIAIMFSSSLIITGIIQVTIILNKK